MSESATVEPKAKKRTRGPDKKPRKRRAPKATPSAANDPQAPVPIDVTKLTDAELYALCWEAGELSYLLRPYQLDIFRQIKAELWGSTGYLNPKGRFRRFVLELHRRFGKSFLIAVIVCELCRVKAGAKVFWAAETAKQVQTFLVPLLRTILADCPEHLRPAWNRQDGVWTWPNGSQIHMAGCEDEGRCDRLRGSGCDLFVIDEAGSITPLDYLYRSVALWMTAYPHNGRILMPSTPARSPGHPFTTYCQLAESGESGFAHRDVYQSGFPLDEIEELAQECRGKNTPQWRREALALRVVDADRAVVPEFSEPGAENEIVLPMCVRCGLHFDKHTDEKCADGQPFYWAIKRPDYFDAYVSMDPGHNPSLTAVGFGYWDFRTAKLVIEDELTMGGKTTADEAALIKAKEAELWGAHFERMRRENRDDDQCQPWARISDVAPQVLTDLAVLHQLPFRPTRKDDKDAQIAELRLYVQQRKVHIHPRCREIRKHLRVGIWKTSGRAYEFIDGCGHLDHLDQLVYLIRNLDKNHNPYPAIPHGVTSDTHWICTPAANTNLPEHLRGWAELFRPPKVG